MNIIQFYSIVSLGAAPRRAEGAVAGEQRRDSEPRGAWRGLTHASTAEWDPTLEYLLCLDSLTPGW